MLAARARTGPAGAEGTGPEPPASGRPSGGSTGRARPREPGPRARGVRGPRDDTWARPRHGRAVDVLFLRALGIIRSRRGIGHDRAVTWKRLLCGAARGGKLSPSPPRQDGTWCGGSRGSEVMLRGRKPAASTDRREVTREGADGAEPWCAKLAGRRSEALSEWPPRVRFAGRVTGDPASVTVLARRGPGVSKARDGRCQMRQGDRRRVGGQRRRVGVCGQRTTGDLVSGDHRRSGRGSGTSLRSGKAQRL